MKFRSVISSIILAACSFLTAETIFAVTPTIVGPDMEIIENNILVNLAIDNVDELESIINSGIGKEIVFTVELLRVWRFWPDEFVVSKKVKKGIKYDNLREQYLVSSDDGISRTEIKLENYSTVKSRLFSAAAINLANIKELEPGSYYIRGVVESKSLEQLPFIGFLMHLIPEVEMSLAKESRPFTVEVSE